METNPKPAGDAAALIDFVTAQYGSQLLEPEKALLAMGTPVVVAVPKGMELKSLKPFAEEYLPRPRRRSGIAVLESATSFIAHVNRHKSDHSVIFANPSREAPSFTAVFDYQEAGGQGLPDWAGHRASYAPRLDDAWKVWIAREAAGAMDQWAFAEFIEDRAEDLSIPPDPDSDLGRLAQKLLGSYAGPLRMMELSKGLSIHEQGAAKAIVNIQSGEAKLGFESAHTDAQGAPLTIPSLFCITVPVFHLDAAYEIAVRLRYRLKAGAISWTIGIYRADRIFDHAFDHMVKKIEAETGITPFMGKPEVSPATQAGARA